MGICPERLTRAGVTSTWSECLQHLLGSSSQSPVWQATQTADIAWAGQQFRRRFKPQHISIMSKFTGKGLRPAHPRWLASWSQGCKDAQRMQRMQRQQSTLPQEGRDQQLRGVESSLRTQRWYCLSCSVLCSRLLACLTNIPQVYRD